MQQKRALNGGKNHYIAFDPWNLALHSMSLWSLDKLLFTSCIFTSIFFTSISVSWAFEFNSLYSFWSKLHKNQHVKQTDANQMNVAGKLTSLNSKNSNWREHGESMHMQIIWCDAIYKQISRNFHHLWALVISFLKSLSGGSLPLSTPLILSLYSSIL